MTLDRGSRDDTTAHDRRFLPGLSSSPSPVASPSLFNDAALSSAPSRLLSSPSRPFSSPPFLSSSERRQVGVRAAVNSPAPLSTLMSLLLFALLNAIRAYSVSLLPLLGPRATTSSFRLSRTNVVVWLTHGRAHIPIHARGPRSLPRLFCVHADSATGTRTRTQHADAYRRARNARYRAGGTARGYSNQPQTCIRTLLCNF